MADTPNLPDCNPVLFIDSEKTLWLFWIIVQDNEWGGSLLKYRTSRDYEGIGPPNWDWQDVIHTRPEKLAEHFIKLLEGAEEKLAPLIVAMPGLKDEIEAIRVGVNNKRTTRLGWMTRIRPIITSDQRIMLGLYSDVFNCSLAAWTSDGGKTWECSEPILHPEVNMLGNVQPSFAERKNGEIVAYMRDNGIPNYVRTAVSRDGGRTWGDHGMEQSIRDSGSSVAVEVLKSGAWILVNNDLIDGRHEISVHLSSDEGKTWSHKALIEQAEKDKGSFSYPCTLQTSDGNIHVTYSYKRDDIKGSTIKHVRFNEEWIRESPKAN